MLGELIMQLVARRQITYLDAHVAESTIALYSLLSAHDWKQVDRGYIFYKPF
ncbi:hypothetical protein FACS189419_10050 [Planctomycetales bacterium]|nr:hypothetical protein FACS189419_10050 [Planctomycetales bacterium]